MTYAGDVTIDNNYDAIDNINITTENGSMTLNGYIKSKKDVQLTSDENVIANRTIEGANVDVNAVGNVTFNDSVTAIESGDINVSTTNGSIATSTQGILMARNVILNSNENVVLRARADAEKDINIEAGQDIRFTEELKAGTEMNLITETGTITGSGPISANAGNLTIRSNAIGTALTAEDNSIDIDGTITNTLPVLKKYCKINVSRKRYIFIWRKYR